MTNSQNQQLCGNQHCNQHCKLTEISNAHTKISLTTPDKMLL